MAGIHTGLGVGLPLCGRLTSPWWAVSLATIDWPGAVDVQYWVIEGMEVGDARNRIAEEAIRMGKKYLWFIDDDTAPPRHAAKKLFHVLQQNDDAMVCGGIYCGRTENPEPFVTMAPRDGFYWKWKPGDVFDCDGLGTGCMMIRTSVFEKLEKPWFKTVDNIDTENETGEKTSDDLYFCRKVKEAGMRIVAHGGVLPLHWDVNRGISYAIPSEPNGNGYIQEPRAMPIHQAMKGVQPIA